MSPWISEAEVLIGGWPSRGTFLEVLEAWISITKTKYKEKS